LRWAAKAKSEAHKNMIYEFIDISAHDESSCALPNGTNSRTRKVEGKLFHNAENGAPDETLSSRDIYAREKTDG